MLTSAIRAAALHILLFGRLGGACAYGLLAGLLPRRDQAMLTLVMPHKSSG